MKQAIQANDIAEGGVYTYQGQRVRVLAVDPDQTSNVWIIFLEDVDRDAIVDPKELS